MTSALSEQGRHAIREEYSNALNFSDGDIFRHLRYCKLQGKPVGKWLSKLSDSKRRDLKQLEKLAGEDTHMKKFRDSLDALILYTGLWSAMKIRTFHRLLPLRCPEELTHIYTKSRQLGTRYWGVLENSVCSLTHTQCKAWKEGALDIRQKISYSWKVG